jgi:hypothetical protein
MLLKAAWQTVCRPFSDQFCRLSTLRSLLAALVLTPLSALLAAESKISSPNDTANSQPSGAVTRELIGDPHFEQGCILCEPKTGRHIEYGTIAGFAKSGNAVRGLAQWTSREKLPPGPPQILPSGALCYSNAAKAVTFGAVGTEDADLTVAVKGGFEYAGRPRMKCEPWPHLLVQ